MWRQTGRLGLPPRKSRRCRRTGASKSRSLALYLRGGADMVSVYVRPMLVQIVTPDAARGRVASVSFLFTAARLFPALRKVDRLG